MALRIGGLASGMDTESIVKELMKVQSMKLDKFKQQKTKMEWKRDSYREFNTQLLDFRSKITNMKLSTTFRSRTTASSDDTRVTATATSAAGLGSFTMNSVSKLATSAHRTGSSIGSNVSTSTALYNNPAMMGSVDWDSGSVERKTLTGNGSDTVSFYTTEAPIELKVGEKMSIKVGSVSYELISDGVDFTEGKKQVKLNPNGDLKFSENINNGSSITVNYVTDSRTDTIQIGEKATTFSLSRGSIDMSSDITFSLEFKEKEGNTEIPEDTSYVIKSTASHQNEKVFQVLDSSNNQVGTFDKETGKVTLNNGNFGEHAATVSTTYKQNYTTTSLSTTRDNVTLNETFFITGNQTLDQFTSTVNASNLGVSMFYDSHTGQMTMNAKETGESSINFTGTNTNDLFKNLLGFGSLSSSNDGQNAKFNLNGLETERSTNNFTINGVNFTLKKTFNATTDGAVTVGVNNDVDAVVKNIKDFVDSYNKLVESINTKVTERVNRNYAPPTDEEKEALSEKQLEEWITQAKSGLMRNDSILNSALSGMRMDFYGAVSNSGVDTVYNQLTQIGISTTANYLDGGKLEINETKLRQALEADPEGVEALFTADGTTDSSQGILNRLTDTVNGVMDRLKEKAGNSFSTNQTFALGREIDSVDDQIERWKDRLQTMEDRYWKQFSAMEKAIQNANAQSASISQFFMQQ